jgi:hypothetical protein
MTSEEFIIKTLGELCRAKSNGKKYYYIFNETLSPNDVPLIKMRLTEAGFCDMIITQCKTCGNKFDLIFTL